MGRRRLATTLHSFCDAWSKKSDSAGKSPAAGRSDLAANPHRDWAPHDGAGLAPPDTEVDQEWLRKPQGLVPELTGIDASRAPELVHSAAPAGKPQPCSARAVMLQPFRRADTKPRAKREAMNVQAERSHSDRRSPVVTRRRPRAAAAAPVVPLVGGRAALVVAPTHARLCALWRRAIYAAARAVQTAFEAEAVPRAGLRLIQHRLRDERAWLSNFERSWRWL